MGNSSRELLIAAKAGSTERGERRGISPIRRLVCTM
jgi:hypothetical protein